MTQGYFPSPPSAEEAKTNPVALLELREHLSREKLVKIEEQKLVREELKLCYRREGVNHISKCKDVSAGPRDTSFGPVAMPLTSLTPFPSSRSPLAVGARVH
uniref:Uncharacterized protein n=1 Tax=Chloropicon primus TaxID=1764295 RepID=A0A7S2T1I3_9CHLO|mmetsp:Transcript_14594/g.41650  ORF Transcript_14594/g.41650 Transcript_14594/m.41650 type:complete len:102 (+) Transcript_14594:143-448(+)